MKSEIQDGENQASGITYPVLMKSKATGNVVLFLEPCRGLAMTTDPTWKVAEESKIWVPADKPNYWTRFTGKITLSND